MLVQRIMVSGRRFNVVVEVVVCQVRIVSDPPTVFATDKLIPSVIYSPSSTTTGFTSTVSSPPICRLST